MNGQPLGKKNTIRLIVILIILMGATQTLLHQWGYGAEIPSAGQSTPPAQPPEAAAERFVPAPLATGRSSTLEMRGEATVQGAEIRLKQIFRWSSVDAASFSQLGELVVAHFDARSAFRTISLDEVRQTLHDAGVNLALIHFAGPTASTVSRSDVAFDEATALDQWINSRDKAKQLDQGAITAADRQATQAPVLRATPTEAPAGSVVSETGAKDAPSKKASAKAEAAGDEGSVRTLKDLLLSDLSVRLSVPTDDLQVNFNPADQKLLSLAKPTFKFNVSGHYIHNLGDVQWDVLLVSDDGSKKATVSATARAWQKQVVLLRPLADHQVLQASDVSEKRALVDRLPDEALLSVSQVVGQQTARSLKPGQVFTARMVDAVPLAKAGQFVTVNLQQGGIRLKTVVRAVEGGSYGQSIRVRNESTRDTYEVTLTGPQEAVMGPLPGGDGKGAEAPGTVASGLDN